MKHPIPLTIGKVKFRLIILLLKQPVLAVPQIRKKSLGNNATDDSNVGVGGDEDEDEDDSKFELMGGYGYFDFGELELRSDEVSRNESYLNSQVQSNLSVPCLQDVTPLPICRRLLVGHMIATYRNSYNNNNNNKI